MWVIMVNCNTWENETVFKPSALKVCTGIVFTNDVQPGGQAIIRKMGDQAIGRAIRKICEEKELCIGEFGGNIAQGSRYPTSWCDLDFVLDVVAVTLIFKILS